jgi:hypothetical protein
MSTTNYPPPGGQLVGETTTTVMGGGSHTHRRISWAAIFGGVILTVTVQLLLSFLGGGIGLSQVDINAGTTPSAGSLGIGAGIWWIVSGCIALGFGGYVAAWLAGIEHRFDGVLHGLIAWGISMLLILYLLSSAIGGIIGGGFSTLGSVTRAAGAGISEVAKPVAQVAGFSPDMLQQQAQGYLQPANPDPATMSASDAQKDVATNLVTYAKGGNHAQAAKERIIAVMAAQMHISHDQATKKFDENQAKLQQARDAAVQDAKNAADASAAAASKGAFAAFGMLLLGAICAAIGGAIAVQRRVQFTGRTIR